MNALFEYLISENMVESIYLTLVHSIWQGAIISVIAGIIIVITKRSNPVWRYNLLLGSLLLFVFCAVFTFVKQTQNIAGNIQVLNADSEISAGANIPYNAIVQSGTKNTRDEIIAFFNANANVIVIFWFLVICFKCSQLLIGLSETVSLRKKDIFPAGDYWEKRLQELSTQLHINQYIQIAQSGLAKVPLTIGHFKPVILIPLGLLAAMPQSQIEAILLHELAHIRRKDYLVNILQNLVEILFFFNPAVWWLSSLLRSERENCCDDLAVAKTNSKANYIKALVAFEEYGGKVPQYASAISGSKNHLLNRAKRLIYNHNKTLNPMEKIILTCGLVITGMLTVAFTQIEKRIVNKHALPSEITRAPEILISQRSAVVLDTTKKVAQNSIINTKVDGKMYRMITKDGQITELYVDNVRVPDDKISNYKTITNKIQEETEKSRILAQKARLDAQQSRLLAEDVRKQAEKARIMATQQSVQARKQAADSKEVSEKMKLAADDLSKQSEQVRVVSEKLKQEVEAIKLQNLEIEKNQADRSSADAEKRFLKMREQQENLNRQMEQINIQIQKIKEDADKMKRAVQEDKKSSRIGYEPKEIVYAGLDVKPRQPLFDVRRQIRAVSPVGPDYVNSRISYQPNPDSFKNIFGEKVTQELINQGIILNKNVTFHITNDELTVDGVKQSDEVRQKVLSKASITGSDRIDLTYSSRTNTSAK